MRIGDKVKVVKAGKTYANFWDMAKKLDSISWSRGYVPLNGHTGIVKNFCEQDGKNFVMVSHMYREFIIGKDGLEVLQKSKFIARLKQAIRVFRGIE